MPTSQVRPQGRSQTQDAHSLCCTPAFHLPWGTLPASPGSHSLGRGPGSCPRPQARPLWEAGNGLVQRTCCGPCSSLRPSFLRAWKRPFKGAETCPPHSLSALLGQVRPPPTPTPQPTAHPDPPSPLVLPLPQRPGFPEPLPGSRPQPLPAPRASQGRMTPVTNPQCLLGLCQPPSHLRSAPQQGKLRLRGP